MITGASTLDPGFPTWGKMLREQGYSTYWYGKWHLTRGDRIWGEFDATLLALAESLTIEDLLKRAAKAGLRKPVTDPLNFVI